MLKKIVTGFIATASILSMTGNSFANEFPEKEINLHIGFSKNNISETIADIFAEGIKKVSGQNVNIIKEASVNGANLSEEVLNFENDGYTLALANTSSLISDKDASNSILNSVSLISSFATSPNILVVSNSFPAKDFKSFEAELQRAKGKYSFASYGRGSISHLLMQSLKNDTGWSILHIPYGKPIQALNDVASNKVDGMITSYASALPYIASNKVKVIAVSGTQRISSLANTPTFNELGHEKSNKVAYFSIVGPKDMTSGAIDKVSKVVEKVSQDPEVIAKLEKIGASSKYIPGSNLKLTLENDLDFYSNILKTAN